MEPPLSSDRELQEFYLVEQQRANFQAQVRRLNELCWEKCVDSPGTRLGHRTETCVANCVDRFIDTSMTITRRFAAMLQTSGASSD